MAQLNGTEKLEYKTKLLKHMEDFILDICENNHNIGWLPENMGENMANAAFSLIENTNDLNNFLEKEELLK